MTAKVNSLEHATALHISVGIADIAHTWLLRLLQDWADNRIHSKISSITILRISPHLIAKLSENGLIDPEFGRRLDNNLEVIISSKVLNEFDIPIRIKHLDKLPEYHGYMFGQFLFCGRWRIDKSGFLHVRTELTEFSNTDRREEAEEIKRWFREAGNLQAGTSSSLPIST